MFHIIVPMLSDYRNGIYIMVYNLPSLVQNDDHRFNDYKGEKKNEFMHDQKRTDQHTGDNNILFSYRIIPYIR